jgi:hypothetical protein
MSIKPPKALPTGSPIQRISDILAAIDDIKEKITSSNPLDDRLNFKYADAKLLLMAKNSPAYKKLVGYFSYTFTVKEPRAIQRKIQQCITALQIVNDDALREGLLDDNKNWLFTVVRGALTKLFNLVNPFSTQLNIQTKDSTQILKLFSAIDTTLSSLASIEVKLYKDAPSQFITSFRQIPESDQKTFIIANWNGRMANELELPVAVETFRYLLAEKDVEKKLNASELLRIFEGMEENARLNFIKILVPLLVPNEKRVLSDLLKVT